MDILLTLNFSEAEIQTLKYERFQPYRTLIQKRIFAIYLVSLTLESLGTDKQFLTMHDAVLHIQHDEQSYLWKKEVMQTNFAN